MEFLILLLLLVLIIFKTDATIAIADDRILDQIISRKEMVQWAGYGEEKLSTITITGKILCRLATSRKSSQYRIPVSGALVAISCTGNKESLVKGSSDTYGEFKIDLPSNLHAIPNIERMCHVKVYHVPRSSPCGEAFTGKNKALRLAYTGEGVRSYTSDIVYLSLVRSTNEIKDTSKKGQTKSLL